MFIKLKVIAILPSLLSGLSLNSPGFPVWFFWSSFEGNACCLRRLCETIHSSPSHNADLRTSHTHRRRAGFCGELCRCSLSESSFSGPGPFPTARLGTRWTPTPLALLIKQQRAHTVLSPTHRGCLSLREHKTASGSPEFGDIQGEYTAASPQSAVVAAALGSGQGRFLKRSLAPRSGVSEFSARLFGRNYLLDNHSLSPTLYRCPG